MAKSVTGRLKLTTGVPNNFAFADLSKLKSEFVKQVHTKFLLMAKQHEQLVIQPLAFLMTSSLEDQVVMQDLLGDGKSLGHFGLVIDQVKTFSKEFNKYMEKNIFVTPIVSGNGDSIMVSTELRFYIDYKEISRLSEAEYISEKSGTNIPWVEWLLTMGTQEIIKDYRITFNPEIVDGSNSRSGKALMVKAKDKLWSVPEEFAGTSEDNMIVNALKDLTGAWQSDRVMFTMQNYYNKIFNSIFS